MADALDKLAKLTERDSMPVTTLLDHGGKGAAVRGVRTERNLTQRRQDITGWLAKVTTVR